MIPAARERDIGVIGMKSLGAGNYIHPESGLTPETLIRFALSQDVDLVIVGCSTAGETHFLAPSLVRSMYLWVRSQPTRFIETVGPYAHRLAYIAGLPEYLLVITPIPIPMTMRLPPLNTPRPFNLSKEVPKIK